MFREGLITLETFLDYYFLHKNVKNLCNYSGLSIKN